MPHSLSNRCALNVKQSEDILLTELIFEIGYCRTFTLTIIQLSANITSILSSQFFYQVLCTHVSQPGTTITAISLKSESVFTYFWGE